MGKIKTVELTRAQRAALEKGYRIGSSHAFRLRCRMILLKSEQRTAAEIADLLGCCEVVVNNWLKRYEAEGIEGLRTKPGRGRKPVLDAEKDLPSVKAAVAANRQRIGLAKAELEAELGKTLSTKTLARYIKKHGARYKRIRKRPAKEPCPEVYELKVECLGELEQLSKPGLIDLYYGDESRVSIDPCVPYGRQFAGEEVFMPAVKGVGINCFALLTRGNDLLFATTRRRVTSQFIIEQLERLSFSVKRMTVVVLDNARVHTSQQVQERRPYRQQRGLFIFYLPPYSPHLNIAERLWRKLKYEWLQPLDYATTDGLFYRVRQAPAAVGTNLKIRLSEFSPSLS